MRDTSAIGNKTAGIILAALMEAGKRPLLPFGDGHRYDLAFDDDGKLQRVQCKTGRLIKGAVYFRTASVGRDGTYKPYEDEVDFFGVYCSATRQAYLVPVYEVPPRGACLRVETPRSGQKQGIRWAKDYVIKPIFS